MIPFKNVSSLSYTSSPVTVRPFTLDHFPIVLFHPIILPCMSEYPSILVSERIVESYILTPGPITQFLPITTLGPNFADESTYADS